MSKNISQANARSQIRSSFSSTVSTSCRKRLGTKVWRLGRLCRPWVYRSAIEVSPHSSAAQEGKEMKTRTEWLYWKPMTLFEGHHTWSTSVVLVWSDPTTLRLKKNVSLTSVKHSCLTNRNSLIFCRWGFVESQNMQQKSLTVVSLLKHKAVFWRWVDSLNGSSLKQSYVGLPVMWTRWMCKM